ncbi:MAG: ABC transporter ATP-binding protein [Tissierellia bacterium]|nr:ABC transporter ATP-binding protein [Tissierellia bacterium]
MEVLSFNNVKKSYGNKEVLHGITFDVIPGRPMAFLGRNGAGKTTAIRALMQIFLPSAGEILIGGKPFKPSEYKIGYLPEERGMYQKVKILEQLIYFSMLKGASKKQARSSAREMLEKVGLSEYENSKLEILSKGNQQKVQICQALLNDPDIIVLDEPFSGLDPVNSGVLMDLIKETFDSNKLMFFSSHQMGYVDEICKDIALLRDGNVVLKGSIDEIRSSMGEGRLIIEAENFSPNKLRDYLSLNVPEVEVEEYSGKSIVKLGSIDKNTLLKSLLDDNVVIKSFANYEPSIGEIFIKYVGDDNEKHK